MNTPKNLFQAQHTIAANGEKLRIVEMGADHLINTLNRILLLDPAKAMKAARAQLIGTYAPDDMDARTARLLGLPTITVAKKQEAELRLAEIEEEIINRALQFCTPYLLVALSRDDTHAGAKAILQKVTGITSQVQIPVFEPEGMNLLPEKIEGIPDEWLVDGFEEENFTPEIAEEGEVLTDEDYE